MAPGEPPMRHPAEVPRTDQGRWLPGRLENQLFGVGEPIVDTGPSASRGLAILSGSEVEAAGPPAPRKLARQRVDLPERPHWQQQCTRA